MLRRFWFDFAVGNPEDLPAGVKMGCGVTATSLEEAMMIITERVFGGAPLPRMKNVISDIDISTLDAGHVRPNMGNPAVLGVWFPLGY